jgi:uncharacterized RDD family membrane protein YckC
LPGVRAAGPRPRLAAALVDAGILAPAVLVLGYLAGRMSSTPHAYPAIFNYLAAAGSVYVLAVVIGQLRLLATQGQTFGKRALNLRIVRLDGTTAGFSEAFVLRSLIAQIVLFTLPSLVLGPRVAWLLWVADVAFVFRPDRRCIHDFIAHTRVVELPADGEQRPLV